MYQQHFHTIGSTQIYLKENLERLKLTDNDLLISCSEQTDGIGRKGNTWDSYPNSLAISFTLTPNETPTLTPIEIGLLAISFFRKKFNKELFLKWPNDILTSEGKKCGGILCQYIDSSTLIAGLGVNLGKLPTYENNYEHGLGNVDQNLELSTHDQEQVSKELYLFILENRFKSTADIKEAFTKSCFHMNKNVFIYENNKDYIGVFKGIDNNGEALVEIESHIQPFLSSSLTILD